MPSLSDTYRREGPANDTSSFASFVGAALQGAERIYNFRTERRRNQEAEQDRQRARTRQDEADKRDRERDRREQERFETDQDQEGYVRTGTTLRTEGEKLERSGNPLAMMAGGLMMGQDAVARRDGRAWVKGKESTQERQENARRDRETELARVRGEGAAEVARVRADAQREIQSSREALKLAEMEARMAGRWNMSNGGSNSRTREERDLERAEKSTANARSRYDRTMSRRPEPGELDVIESDEQGNPTRFSRPFEERMRGWRGDSTMVANDLERSERRLGALLGDEPAEMQRQPAPAAPKRGGFNSREGQAIQAQYDEAAREYQDAVARIKDPNKRAQARAIYEQRLKEIGRAVGDIDR